MKKLVAARLEESIMVKKSLLADGRMLETVVNIAGKMLESLRNGGTIYLCGNGGSASDAQHIAGELVGRFQMERRAMPAVALSCDGAIMSCIMNDYGADHVFERQVEAYIRPQDLLVGISTSGNSENVIRALVKANEMGAFTVGLLGKDGGRARTVCGISLVIPSETTARVQECHITIGHILCELIEKGMFT